MGLENRNGRLIGYKICYKLSSSFAPCENAAYVSHKINSYLIKDLKPFTEYNIEISAGTIAGYGPPITTKEKTQESSKLLIWRRKFTYRGTPNYFTVYFKRFYLTPLRLL